jgi:4-aminobutyrate aminotransferase-like enzyme
MELKSKRILEMNAFNMNGISVDKNSLLSRRLQNFGAASVLFYDEPIEMVSGKGTWMWDKSGHKYLDFYNNVPSVGHCHPAVTCAISKQVAQLNIHTRYLNETVDDYLDSLKQTLPDNLNNVLLCCTGSEANDLALRIARKKTGKQGIIVTETAYHGNTQAVTEVSPAALKNTPLPGYVITIPPPSSLYYGPDIAKGFADAVTAAIDELEQRGYGLAALLCDSIFSSDGVFSDPEGFLQETISRVHNRGGVYIADEVQPGFGRCGTCMWGFQRHDVVPDIVTMGKPMGNGFPMAGVAANAADVQYFCDNVGYFNTFGGNPVAAAAGAAVLNIIKEENLMNNATIQGNHVRNGIKQLQSDFPIIGDVRGAGLFIGVDICSEDSSKPEPLLAASIIKFLKTNKILVGAAGKYGNTLKLRPPLCVTTQESDIFLCGLQDALRYVCKETLQKNK